MKAQSLYTDELWKQFVEKTNKNKRSKTYKHFDDVFDFKLHSDRIRKIVSDPDLKKVATHSFVPHVKILTKTPKYRFDETLNGFALETKIRPISFASHFDSYIYSFFAYSLTKLYEQTIKISGFDASVLAYRSDLSGDCNIQFAKRAFDAVKSMVSDFGECSAIALDIKGYFDNIDHNLLKEKWCKVIDNPELPIDQYKIFRSLTKYSYINKSSFLKHFDIYPKNLGKAFNLLDLIPDEIAGPSYREKFGLLRSRKLIVRNKLKANDPHPHRGIPQGSPMSSVLSNIYLFDFDQWLHSLSMQMKFHYFRYCDDILIICQSQDVQDLEEKVTEEINKKYRLTIQKKKTEIIEFRKDSNGVLKSYNARQSGVKNSTGNLKNLQYLGFEFNGRDSYIRPGSLSRYFRKAKGRITKTMMMAYGKKGITGKVFKKLLYERYSHMGNRNFISYALTAAKKEYKNREGIIKPSLDSVTIRRQLSAHFDILNKEIRKTSFQFAHSRQVSEKE